MHPQQRVEDGDAGQVARDLARLGALGVTEVIAWGGGATTEGFLQAMERFREAAAGA